MQTWLANNWQQAGCTALLAHNDYVAIGVMDALREAGLRVPDDIAVVGFDGLEVGQFVSPRLTTVEVPLHEIGAQAVEMLCAQIESGQRSAEHRLLPTRMVQGQSCGAAPVDTAVAC